MVHSKSTTNFAEYGQNNYSATKQRGSLVSVRWVSAGSNPGCLDHVVQDCRASRNRSPLPEYPSEKKWVRGRKGSTNTHAPGDGKEPRDERWDESQLGYQQMEEAVLRCDEGLSAAENAGKLPGSRTPDPVHSARRFIMECALALACRRLLRTPCPLQ
ncbi:hypothetical protein SCLCIDRAFT_860443 [Scleroderma citrinum Foug A]|uniref:Uncharacterized protein n=1 Tax=Scleroderma citrinum Foug A TaxID=1036808 RepID=A0A0C3E057_9AGAM|nr:hypothetical protein SCLCIDRAFT_860443 [Scleroderma citrinum Foug A]